MLPVSLTIKRIGSPYSIGALSLLNVMTTPPYKRNNNTKYSKYTHTRGYVQFNKYANTHTHTIDPRSGGSIRMAYNG